MTVESGPPVPEWMRRVRERLARVAARLPRAGAVTEIGARRGRVAAQRAAETQRMLTDTSLAQELPASPLPTAGALAAIGCPVLCLYGGDSAVVELAPTVRWAAAADPGRGAARPEAHVLIDRPEEVRRLVLRLARRGLLARRGPTATTA